MAEVMAPAVGGTRQWRTAAGLHVAAGGAAGGVVGLMAAAIGAVIPVGSLMLAMVAALAAARELWWPASRLPGRAAQVPRRWGDELEPSAAALAYGAVLGVGFATYVTTAAYWVTMLAAAHTARPGPGFAVGASFGVARAGAVVAANAGSRTWVKVHERNAALAAVATPARLMVAIVLALLVVVSLLSR
jgi:hypothetical protein